MILEQSSSGFLLAGTPGDGTTGTYQGASVASTMVHIGKEAGVALLVGFVAGAISLLGQLMYAQLVVMPRAMTSTGSLAVSVDSRWSFFVALLAAAAYFAWQMRPGGRRG
jgi:hypothetical protein